MSYALRKETAIWRNPSFVAVVLAHGLGLAALAHWDMQQPDSVILQVMSVRMIEPEVPKTVAPKLPQPKPAPKAAAVEPPRPVLTAPSDTPAPAAFAVAPQPPSPPRTEIAPAAPPAPAVTAARFDADYLQNPKPAYPPISRRLNEQGKVVLRVHVAADGSAQAVEVKQSSGFPRLDAAARDAVSRWHFVPARRGTEATESWVAVPIQFSLEH